MKTCLSIKKLHSTPTNTGVNTHFSCFTFTGKERDEETGYSYHGARYYDPSLSGIWLTVDPMADKYQWISPYAYCAWNPMRLIDPDGMNFWQPEITSKGAVSYVAEKGDSKESFIKQYDISSADADKVFTKEGIKAVQEGTRISGETIASTVEAKANQKYDDLLRLNWNNATDKQKIYHTMFSILCNKRRGSDCVDLNYFIKGLPSATGDNANIRYNKPVKIPLLDGKTMFLQSFISSFSKQFSSLLPQPPNQFQNSDGTYSYNQQFIQPTSNGCGIPRLLIAYPEKYYNSYNNSYYE